MFRIKKVPIFYLPYMRYPLDRERATGFLMPQAGYNQIKGFSVSQGFYWAIARNMDATFSADFYAAKGVGGGLEYRYIFGDGTTGQANLYYYDHGNRSAPNASYYDTYDAAAAAAGRPTSGAYTGYGIAGEIGFRWRSLEPVLGIDWFNSTRGAVTLAGPDQEEREWSSSSSRISSTRSRWRTSAESS